MNRICNTCSIKINENDYLKIRTVCKSCYKKNRRKNNNNTLIQNQQPEIDNVNTNKNNRPLLVGPSFSGETYLMFKNLSRIPNRDFYTISKSLPNSIPILKSKLVK